MREAVISTGHVQGYHVTLVKRSTAAPGKNGGKATVGAKYFNRFSLLSSKQKLPVSESDTSKSSNECTEVHKKINFP